MNDKTERELIAEKYKRLRKLFSSLPNTTPRLLKFCNRLGTIESKSNGSFDGVSDAASQLDDLMNELKSADDGQGGLILDMKRWERFFVTNDADPAGVDDLRRPSSS